MHSQLDKIKLLESKPKVLKKFFSSNDLDKFLNLYECLPTTVDNKKQKVIKKRWIEGYGKDLELFFKKKLESELGLFKMDNLISDDGKECFGLFQESYNPLKLHVDAGFNLNDLIYKQTLVPLSKYGQTVIFKNRFYGYSTNFTRNEAELTENNENEFKKGKNVRSDKHLEMFGDKSFDEKNYKKYLIHEDIDNLRGLELEFIYEWNLGDLLIFDRTNLHCSSSNIKDKKIGLTTFTKK